MIEETEQQAEEKLDILNPKLDYSTQIQSLVLDVYRDEAKHVVKTLLDIRKASILEIARLKECIEYQEGLLQTAETRLQNLADGDATILALNPQKQCRKCLNSTYNEFYHSVCPNCGGKNGR